MADFYLGDEQEEHLPGCMGLVEGEDGGRMSRAARAKFIKHRNAQLTGDQAVDAARETALRQLDVRMRSRAELRAVMVAQGFHESIAAEVLDRLERVDLIDDHAFAFALARHCFSVKGQTGRAIRMQLERHCLSSEDIDDALSQFDIDDELSRARELVKAKSRSLGSVSSDRAFRRLTGLLVRRGYSPAICHAVVTEALQNMTQ